ncbi:hypothetical protein HUT16_31210 [Kitasatospora sp. NA04385]|uniref:hypothetical protein n=1 Tax=Kitasatospora sp. NA04385 TaxID=2742135 RepID=UPI0015905D72|nr:hypothetical protein [Kitasatospora sp. NA04385]QKW22954.1 hypothetical protein HUT16_31210 [Kitasatospora sp. NA04385]
MDPDLDLELSTLMEASVKDLCVPVAVIMAESGRRGRRRRLFRRLRIAGTTLAVLAVALAGANIGLPLIEAGRPPVGDIAPAGRPASHPAGPPAPAAPDTPTTPPDPSAGAPGDGGGVGRALPLEHVPPIGRPSPSGKPAAEELRRFTVANVVDDLEAMRPGMAQALGSQSWDPTGRPAGTEGMVFYYKGEEGRTGAVELTMRKADRPFPAMSNLLSNLQTQFWCGPSSGTAGDHQESCLYGYLPDGTWEMVEQNDAMVPGAYSYHVALWRPDGTVLDFTEYSGWVDNRGLIVGADQKLPPIDLTTWRAIAESPSWEYYRPTPDPASP